MSDRDDVLACGVRESAAILDADLTGVRELDREHVLKLMARAYIAGFDLGMEAWGESLDRMQGALAEASA